MEFWSGRERAGSERSPACTRRKQRGSCGCGEGTCRNEERPDADTGAEDSTAKQGGLPSRKSNFAA
eukprot:2458936-Rhodomonas_salina.2